LSQETTAGALSSIIYYLAKHPSFQTLARSEVDRILPSLPSSPDITIEILNNLPTVTACVQESMRMNNPSNYTLPRISNTPKTLGPYAIPSGTRMSFNASSVQHLERTFITPSHDTFDPTRFLVYPTPTDSDEKTAGIPTVSPLTNQIAVFGLGLRQCPARHFALWELRTILTLLLHKYTWSLPDSSPHSDRVINAFSFGTSLNLPKDLDIVFTKRV
jgi:cytochrome P450